MHIKEKYGEKSCDECGSEMRFVREPMTTGYIGYVCKRPECENGYTNTVYDE
jgi:hypothetical protein